MKFVFIVVSIVFCLEGVLISFVRADKSDADTAEDILERASQFEQKGDYNSSLDLYKKIEKKYAKLKRQISDDSGDEDIQENETFGEVAARRLPYVLCKKEGISKRRFEDIDKFIKTLLSALNSMQASSVAKLVDCEPQITSNEALTDVPIPPDQLGAWLINQRRKGEKEKDLPLRVLNKYKSNFIAIIALEKFRDFNQLIIVLQKTKLGWAWNYIYTDPWQEVFSDTLNKPILKMGDHEVESSVNEVKKSK